MLYLELTAPAINHIWATRKPFSNNRRSDRIYDADYNLITVGNGHQGELERFQLSEAAMDRVPCSQLERLMFVLSSTPHQSFLMLHLHLQGLYKPFMLKKYF